MAGGDLHYPAGGEGGVREGKAGGEERVREGKAGGEQSVVSVVTLTSPSPS